MSTFAKANLTFGIIILFLTVLNSLLASDIDPSLQRAEVLAAISSVLLMLAAFVMTDYYPNKNKKAKLLGDQGLIIDNTLSEDILQELGWGSKQLLIATPAATILIYWDNNILLRRGLLGKGNFIPGSTCIEAMNSQKLISLANTKLFPNKHEFDSILENLPSVIIYPLAKRGFVILGGYNTRCFSKSDEKWIIGWSDKLASLLNNI